MNPPRAHVVAPGAGETVRGPAGGPATFKVRAAATGGSITVIENEIAPGQGPPRHLHTREDELFYVLEGHMRVDADGEVLDAPAGATVFIPRNTPHVFQNVGQTPVRLLVVFAPAGMERFFEGMAALPDVPPDPDAIATIAREAGMQVLGPPLPPDTL
jgi:quercetin dioxygenase-like cupin family protein